MIVVNYDKGFAKMSQHPAFRLASFRNHRRYFQWNGLSSISSHRLV